MKIKTTAIVASLFGAMLLVCSGCSSPKFHTYFLGRHVMFMGEKENKAPPLEVHSPGNGEILALSW